MNVQIARVSVRAHLVAMIRSHFEVIDTFVAPGSLLFLDAPSEAFAKSLLLDMTAAEQARVRFSYPTPPPCEFCQTPPSGECARCLGPSCAKCDVCRGCQQLVCDRCDSGGVGPFSFPGDSTPHPHNYD